MSSNLSNDGEPIEVNLGNETSHVTFRINRTAYKSGGVRILGRKSLIAEWFQGHVTRGDAVYMRLIDDDSILLLLKQ